MNLNTNQFASEISDTLATTGKNYTVKAIDLGDYGTSYEITEHDSARTLHITPVEDSLIDMILYGKTGTTLAHGTLCKEILEDITPEELTNLIAICF